MSTKKSEPYISELDIKTKEEKRLYINDFLSNISRLEKDIINEKDKDRKIELENYLNRFKNELRYFNSLDDKSLLSYNEYKQQLESKQQKPEQKPE